MKRGSFMTMHRINGRVDLEEVKGYLAKVEGMDFGIYSLSGGWYVVDLNTGLAIHSGSYPRLYAVKKILPTLAMAFKDAIRIKQKEYSRAMDFYNQRKACWVEETDLSKREDLL